MKIKPSEGPSPVKADMRPLQSVLWRKFLSTPGVWQSFQEELQEFKICGGEETCSEEDFLPLSESSRLSLSESVTLNNGTKESSSPSDVGHPSESVSGSKVNIVQAMRLKLPDCEHVHSPRSPMLPPISPRLHLPDGETPSLGSEESAAFFLEKNIDGLPERNISSPQPVSKTVTPNISKRFSVIRQTRQSVISRVSHDVENISLAGQTQSLTRIPTFNKNLLRASPLSAELVESIQKVFSQLPSGKVTRLSASVLLSEINLHPYLASTLFRCCYGQAESGSCQQFLCFLQHNSMKLIHVTQQVRTFNILARCERNFLVPEDFSLLIETFVLTHPQMEHFSGSECRHLHPAFVSSVTASLFFSARAWRQKKMCLKQFLLLDFNGVLKSLSDNILDINFVPYFSYDQFYVFYAKFVHLDCDEDFFLNREELSEYEDEFGGFLCPKLVDRVFMVNTSHRDLMNWWDFFIFLLAHITSCSPSGLEFWFPVLDANDDGVLSMEDLEEFYVQNWLYLVTGDINITCSVQWEDVRNQMVDLLGSTELSLMRLKSKASDKLEHLLSAFIKVSAFLTNDENEVSIRSELNNLQKYVEKYLRQLE